MLRLMMMIVQRMMMMLLVALLMMMMRGAAVGDACDLLLQLRLEVLRRRRGLRLLLGFRVCRLIAQKHFAADTFLYFSVSWVLFKNFSNISFN